MKLFSCNEQEQVVAALREGRWQAACPPELRAHVAACPQCSDLVLVAETLRQARGETMQQTASRSGMATPDTLWWRSELLRRNRAIEQIARPVAVAEKIALAAIPVAFLGLILWQWEPMSDWFAWLTDSSNAVRSSDAAALLPGTTGVVSLVLIMSLVGFVLISTVAFVLLTEKE